ncbi:MAG: hypothetical protein OCD03_13175 [Hyphomicrobiales bacterium]
MSHNADIKLLEEEKTLLGERITAINKEILKISRDKLAEIRKPRLPIAANQNHQ